MALSRTSQKADHPTATSCTERRFGKLTVVERPLDSLRPAPRNARTHSESQLQKLSDSIGRYGLVIPIVIDGSGVIVAGHARLEAARRLGLTTAPTITIAHLNKAELKAFALAENKIASEAGWDPELLALDFAEIRSLDPEFDLELTGFETPELDLIIGDMGEAEDEKATEGELGGAPSVSRLGDLWHLGDHRLLCGNSQAQRSLARLMAGADAAACISDPPYNVAVAGHISVANRAHHPEFQMAAGELDEPGFTAFLCKFFELSTTYCRPGALIYSFMDWRHAGEILEAARRTGLTHLNICVWVKDKSGMGSFYRSQHEFVFVFRKNGAAHRNNVRLGRYGRNRSNIWQYPGFNRFGSDRDQALAWHPTVKPTPLVMDAIKDCTRRGDIVLDPFGGSGTTLIAAERTGRVARCIELEPRYVDVAIRRWQALTGRAAVLEGSDQTFDAVSHARAAEREVA